MRSRILALVIGALLLVWPVAAYADVAPAPAPALSWPAYLALILAALAGIKALLESITMVLKVVAPRTKTPLDDRAEVFFEKLDSWTTDVMDKLQQVTPKVVAPKSGDS